jgi:translocation and assembly module TamA
MRRASLLPLALVATAGATGLAPPAWADTPVIIEGVERATREAILDLLPDRDPPESLFDAERIAEEAAARANAWLRSEGYYAATVTPRASGDPPSARLHIALGQRFAFDAPTIAYDGVIPAAEATTAAAHAAAMLHAGAPARTGDVLAAESGALNALQHAGYADAAALPRRVVVDHATNRVSVELRFIAGERVRLGGIRVRPEGVLRNGFTQGLRSWETGDVYTPQALARVRRDLVSTGAIARASTQLSEPNGEGLSDVLIDVEPARRNAYELGVSYSTTEGAGLQGEWTRRNLTRRADSLATTITLAELQQSASIELTRPHAAGLGHAAAFGVSAGRETLDAYTREGAAIYAGVDASSRLRTATSYGVRLSGDSYSEVSGSVRDAVVLSGFATLRHDTTEFTLDPLDGAVTELRIEPSVSGGDETLAFVRATAEARLYESFSNSNRLTLAARAHAGWLEPIAGSANDAPPDRRFYAGGGGSVRGYDYNSIYPSERDALGLTPGGQGLLEGSIEARWRFNDRWGVAAFVDAGAAFDDWRDARDLSFGAGVGLRYDLGFAPLRFDIAFPVDEDERAGDYALYISIGQAF